MDKYRIDSHKLIYHLSRVNEWAEKGDVYPIYMEISPSGVCNHRCVFCAYDFIGHPNRRLDTDIFLKFIDEASHLGVKSLLYAGEGEPLLHKDIDKFIVRTKEKGIDAGMYTNGQFLKESLAEKILPSLTFIRFSFNGGSGRNYAEIHKTGESVFAEVLRNIGCAAGIKAKRGLVADLGAQYVLLPENIDFLVGAAKILKEAGIGYFAIKPFVQQSERQSYKMREKFNLENIESVVNDVVGLSDENFSVIVRRNAFDRYGERRYAHCFGTSFVSVVNSAGDIASCLPYWDDEQFVFGNIYKTSFEEIWKGEKRREIKRRLECELDVSKCPPNCRPNQINEFLWELKHPSVRHINFI